MSLLETLQSLLRDNPWSDELPDEWEILEDGDWCDNHKSEAKEDIVKHLPSGKIFRVSLGRTGDYWQGYETEFYDAEEVEPYEAVVVLYRPVKLLDVTVPAMSKAKAVSNE